MISVCERERENGPPAPKGRASDKHRPGPRASTCVNKTNPIRPLCLPAGGHTHLVKHGGTFFTAKGRELWIKTKLS